LTFRPLDIQSLIPESYEVSRSSQAEQHQGRNNQQHAAFQLNFRQYYNQRHVRYLSEGEHSQFKKGGDKHKKQRKESEDRKTKRSKKAGIHDKKGNYLDFHA